MGDAVFKAVINILIAVGGALIVWLSVKKIDSLEKQLDHCVIIDTTIVVVSDSISSPFILPE